MHSYYFKMKTNESILTASVLNILNSYFKLMKANDEKATITKPVNKVNKSIHTSESTNVCQGSYNADPNKP